MKMKKIISFLSCMLILLCTIISISTTAAQSPKYDDMGVD